MNREEAAKLLGVVALGDNRQISRELAIYWHGLLSDIRIEDALEAVAEHRRESAEWLQPAHIRRIVKAHRHLRLVTANVVHEPVADETVLQDIARRAQLLGAAADGRIGPRPVHLALVKPDRQAALPPAVQDAVEAARSARGPLSVRCPFCATPAGTACRAGKRVKSGFFHPTRVEAARPPKPEQETA